MCVCEYKRIFGMRRLALMWSVDVISIYYHSRVPPRSPAIDSSRLFHSISRNGSNKLWKLVYANDRQIYDEAMIFWTDKSFSLDFFSPGDDGEGKKLLKVFLDFPRKLGLRFPLPVGTLVKPRFEGAKSCWIIKSVLN